MPRSLLPRLTVVLLLALGPAVLPSVARAEEFPSSDVTLIEHIPLNGFPSNPSSGNDCWGYVSPSGREYALMGVRDAVVVVDITDASSPVIVASISHQSSNWCDIRTYGTYAYAVNESGGGLDVIDLSQVDSGIVTLVQRVTDLGLETCHNISVNEQSGFLYLCASNIFEGRLAAMSLADPADPVIVGNVAVSEGGVPHDAQVVTYDSGPYAGREIAFSSSGTDGIEIYDVTDKGNMFLVSTGTYPNESFTHQAWLHENRQYLYVNDETDGVNETVIMDVSDITTPIYVDAYTSGVEATDHNVFFHDGRIFEAEYRAGMRVFDASDPVAPVQDGWIDTFPGDDSAGSGGVWGVYPFLPSGKVLLSDKNRGLFVVWPGPPPLTFVLAGGTPPDQFDPDGDGFSVQIDALPGHVLDPASPVLVYDSGQGEVETAMLPLGGGVYQAVSGPIPCGALVQYHVRAATTDGIAVRSPIGAPGDSYLAVAAQAAVTVLEDELALGTGWIVGAPGDNAVSGHWTLVDPIATEAQPEVDHTTGPTDTCFVTGQGAPFGNIGDADVDQGVTSLTSPLLDLSQAGQATIAYWRWYHNSFSQIDADEGNGPNEDVLTVWITNDNGQNWVLVETVGPAGPETGGGWFLHAFDVGSLVPLTDQVRLRFVASDVGNLSIVEVAIDDLLAVSVDCTEVWTDLGNGKAGVSGVPALGGTGPMTSGSANAVDLTNAAPSSTTTLVVGFSGLFAPFKGGTLVPMPDLLLFALPIDGAGAASLPFVWPAVPPGITLYWQHWIDDPAASLGLSASNGLSSVSQ
ncbi:MAG: choice-of-anchor B family protein [Planctomycetota bacterium]|jgi:choice-of-anchor B domain-containing protein